MRDAYLTLLPDALQAHLDEQELSYRQAARIAEIDKATVSRLARGVRDRAAPTVALALLMLLDVRPSVLFVMPSRARE